VTVKVWILALALGSAVWSAQAQEELRLWPGKAPGSERWTDVEEVTTSPSGSRTITNVSEPTLTVYLPEPAKAHGTAVVVVPGGGLRMLSIDDSGVAVAKWMNERGIAAFVLKHRVLPRSSPSWRIQVPKPEPGKRLPPEIEIRNANTNPSPEDKELTEVLDMAIADAQRALKLVRDNAKKWRVDPAKVGIMGFSAGGGVGIGTALAPPGDSYPDFLISVFGPSLQDVNVPPHAPPLFMAVGQMHWNVTNGLVALFAKWKEAEKPAELHIYDMISGGVGMIPRGTPSDLWLDSLEAWLQVRGFAPKDNASWAIPHTAN
jgi:dienelactone hydrolase